MASINKRLARLEQRAALPEQDNGTLEWLRTFDFNAYRAAWQRQYGHLPTHQARMERCRRDIAPHLSALLAEHRGQLAGGQLLDTVLADPVAAREASAFARILATGHGRVGTP